MASNEIVVHMLEGLTKAIEKQGEQMAVLAQGMESMQKAMHQRGLVEEKLAKLEKDVDALKAVQQKHSSNWKVVASLLTPAQKILLAAITGLVLLLTQAPVREWIAGW